MMCFRTWTDIQSCNFELDRHHIKVTIHDGTNDLDRHQIKVKQNVSPNIIGWLWKDRMLVPISVDGYGQNVSPNKHHVVLTPSVRQQRRALEGKRTQCA